MECRHDVVFVEMNSETTPTDPVTDDSEDESWLNGPLYWIAIIAAIAVIIGSVATINNNLRERSLGGKVLEEE